MKFSKKDEAGFRSGYTPKGKLGSGARFKAVEKSVASEPGVRNPAAVAAAIGRRKYGAKKMAALSAAGRKRG